MLETLVSSARMISAMRWMFVCVSVRMTALLLSLEEMDASAESSGRRLSTSLPTGT